MPSSGSEDDDYMADTFVAALETTSVRPGLIHSRIAQRQVSVNARKRRHDEQQQSQSRPGIRRLEQQARDEGLQTELPADNKGAAMLARMGYKAGQSLGRSSAAGIREPIGIQVKSDRGGLGREAALKQLSERRDELRRQKLLQMAANKQPTVSTEEFRRRMTQRAQERQMEADLGKCQRACEKLDQQESIESPAMVWFWPIRQAAQPDEDDADDAAKADDEEPTESDELEYETAEKLEMLTTYLRTTYRFCHWCGTEYDSIEDLQQSCPGETKDDH